MLNNYFSPVYQNVGPGPSSRPDIGTRTINPKPQPPLYIDLGKHPKPQPPLYIDLGKHPKPESTLYVDVADPNVENPGIYEEL